MDLPDFTKPFYHGRTRMRSSKDEGPLAAFRSVFLHKLKTGDLMNGFYETMRSKGFSYETTASVRKFNCPNCNFSFSLVYARTFACQGCSEAVKGCPKVRCAKCDYEFFINETPEIHGKEQQRAVADHITNVVNQHYDGLGIRTYNR